MPAASASRPNLAEAFKWFALARREGDRDAAKKRDDVGGRLDQQSLAAAMAAAQAWQPQPQPEAAIQVRLPPAAGTACRRPSTAKRTRRPQGRQASEASCSNKRVLHNKKPPRHVPRAANVATMIGTRLTDSSAVRGTQSSTNCLRLPLCA